MNTLRLGATEIGEGGDEPVVFLHGFGMTRHIWAEMIQPKIARTHRTIALDLPGHGASLSYPDALNAGRFAKAVMGELDRRHLGRVHLVGHSMGGATAALMATGRPERVASLTLLAPGGFGPEINHRLIARFGAARGWAGLFAPLEMMFGWRNDVPVDLVRKLASMRAVPGQAEALGMIAALMTRDGLQGVIPRETLADLAMPVTVVWGEQDCVLPVGHSKGLPSHFHIHVLPECGHMLVEEAPQTVVAILRDQLA